MSGEGAFLRRVRNPNPMLAELARQALDALDARAEDRSFLSIAGVAHEFGTPIEYVLDELERRVREGAS